MDQILKDRKEQDQTDKFVKLLSQYDFSDPLNTLPWLVASINGKHKTKNQKFRYGLERLREIVVQNPYKMESGLKNRKVIY